MTQVYRTVEHRYTSEDLIALLDKMIPGTYGDAPKPVPIHPMSPVMQFYQQLGQFAEFAAEVDEHKWCSITLDPERMAIVAKYSDPFDTDVDCDHVTKSAVWDPAGRRFRLEES